MNYKNSNPIPLGERKYLTKKETSHYTGIGIRKIIDIINSGEFEDVIYIGKQHRVMIDRVAFEEFLKSKKYL